MKHESLCGALSTYYTEHKEAAFLVLLDWEEYVELQREMCGFPEQIPAVNSIKDQYLEVLTTIIRPTPNLKKYTGKTLILLSEDETDLLEIYNSYLSKSNHAEEYHEWLLRDWRK